MKVTLIGTLPPIKCISPYCQKLPKSLSKKVEFEFIGFKRLYLDFLYPGGTKIKDDDYIVPKKKNTKIINVLINYNPFSQIGGRLNAEGGER